MNPEKRIMLPKVAFTGFLSRYREPKPEEGFQDITKVDFRVGCTAPPICESLCIMLTHVKFEGDEEQRTVWTKYWV